MTVPFRPKRGVSVEVPYRISVLRADPNFEYGKRHEPFYEFSNGRKFNEDEERHGAYIVIRQNTTITLSGVAAIGQAGDPAAQGDAGITAELTGVEAQGIVGPLGFENVTPAIVLGVAAASGLGAITPLGQSVVNGSVNLSGLAATGNVGSISVTGTINASKNLTGVAALGQVGTIILNSTSNANVNLSGVSGAAARGNITLNIVNGSVSASVNVPKVSATGVVGTINQGQLQQPIMTITSTAGDPDPTFTFTLDATIVAGDSMTYQEQVAAGDWSSPTVNNVHVFTAGEITAGEVDLVIASRTNGNYEARMKVTKGAIDSAWSNVVSFTASTVTAGTPFGLLLAITK